ncbi:MAG: hypothetical protein QG670_2494 [Thermoproteota archaeon]|nr:hypothetical protein [Thermoproteota archaeon]
MSTSVAITRCNKDIEKSLKEAILTKGFTDLQSPIVIKPNICTNNDRTGFANTKVDIVEAIIRLLLEKQSNPVIRIAESDSGAKYADEVFEKFGYKDLEQRY